MQRDVKLFDGAVDVAETFFGDAAFGVVEQAFGGAHLGVGLALGFAGVAVAAHSPALDTERLFDLFHRADAVAIVIVLALSERGVGIIQQDGGVAVAVRLRLFLRASGFGMLGLLRVGLRGEAKREE